MYLLLWTFLMRVILETLHVH